MLRVQDESLCYYSHHVVYCPVNLYISFSQQDPTSHSRRRSAPAFTSAEPGTSLTSVKKTVAEVVPNDASHAAQLLVLLDIIRNIITCFLTFTTRSLRIVTPLDCYARSPVLRFRMT